MAIHVTPIPSTVSLTNPSFTLGTSNVAGDALTAVASNSTILTYDATVAGTLVYSQSAGTGSATVASRRDHAHGMPASTPVEAIQSQIKDEDTGELYAPIDLLKHSPGVAKIWATWNGGGTVILIENYGVSGISDANTGQYNVNFDVDFADDNYAGFGWCDGGTRNICTQGGGAASKTQSAYQVMTSDLEGNAVDGLEVTAAAFGYL